MPEQPIQNQIRGAASILVIFMMIILVTFGALSLTAASANFRLGTKVERWMNSYYLLDARAELYCAELDSQLLEAERTALGAMSGGIADAEDFGVQFANVYFREALTYLHAWAQRDPLITVQEENGTIGVSFTLTESEAAKDTQTLIPKNLHVTLVLTKPTFEAQQNTEGLSYKRAADFQQRFDIERWQEWQEEAPLQGQGYWDGVIPEANFTP